MPDEQALREADDFVETYFPDASPEAKDAMRNLEGEDIIVVKEINEETDRPPVRYSLAMNPGYEVRVSVFLNGWLFQTIANRGDPTDTAIATDIDEATAIVLETLVDQLIKTKQESAIVN